MIKAYRKGRQFERDLVNEFRAQGCLSARTAGSKSKIDVFSINPLTLEVLFIQAKCGAFHESELKKIEKDLSWIRECKKVKLEVRHKA